MSDIFFTLFESNHRKKQQNQNQNSTPFAQKGKGKVPNRPFTQFPLINTVFIYSSTFWASNLVIEIEPKV